MNFDIDFAIFDMILLQSNILDTYLQLICNSYLKFTLGFFDITITMDHF